MGYLTFNSTDVAIAAFYDFTVVRYIRNGVVSLKEINSMDMEIQRKRKMKQIYILKINNVFILRILFLFTFVPILIKYGCYELY